MVQNTHLRLIYTRKGERTSNKNLHIIANIPQIKEIIHTYIWNTLHLIKNYYNPLLKQIGKTDLNKMPYNHKMELATLLTESILQDFT